MPLKLLKNSHVFTSVLYIFSLCGCVVEIPLHGDISGYVIDSESDLPLPATSLQLTFAGIETDSASTGSDGSYSLRNLEPHEYPYEIMASKQSYGPVTKNVIVKPANTTRIDFSLKGIPVEKVSPLTLDFGLDETSRYFTISNSGRGSLGYLITPTKTWITVSVSSGEVEDETDTIRVGIDRSGLTGSKYEEAVKIIFDIAGEEVIREVIIYSNGVMDEDGQYYGAVRIGTQIWMAENLNTGGQINYPYRDQTNNGEIEKYCYDNDPENCVTYGGLYSWYEGMDYSDPDSGAIGITRGICPDGWHIPTETEWHMLVDFLGGTEVAGRKLKASGTLEDGNGLWHKYPGAEGNNISGFTALPGGTIAINQFTGLSDHCYFWSSSLEYTPWGAVNGSRGLYLGFASTYAGLDLRDIEIEPGYIRCVRDP